MKISKAKNKLHLFLRILLPLLCLATIAFIFSNSLQTATESSKQSGSVVEVVQDVAEVVAPESQIAKGEVSALETLHRVIRKMAHFLEFALLGALFCWTYFVYEEKPARLYIPALAVVPVPCIDESIQLFVQGRGAAFTDVLIDLSGATCGFLFAFGVAMLIFKIMKSRKIAVKE